MFTRAVFEENVYFFIYLLFYKVLVFDKHEVDRTAMRRTHHVITRSLQILHEQFYCLV